ncbi:MAG TPA: glycoside hydrolase family 15 protein [Acidimicrobiales bacterium]|jgi:GH15 family glucan-1,4-alpha-glucosidase
MSYPLISDHGLIGDLQTAALVGTDGTIDWFCCPRFDSPSVFAALVDDQRGGRFTLTPTTAARTSTQMYLPDTAILVTRYLSESGIAEVLDFMPIDQPGLASDHRRIVRAVRGIRGEVEFEARIEPRFDYGRQPHQVHVEGTTAYFECGELRLDLTSISPLERDGDDVQSRFTVREGETAGLVLESGASDGPTGIGHGEVSALALETQAFWQGWLEQCTYRGRWREAVERSAITLKLLTYAPSGGLIAAPTAGLPEQVGGPRNWDYRYTWVRDGSTSITALVGLGFTDEALAFGDWLRRRFEERPADGAAPLKIMYRVDGSSDLFEESLDHLDGYMASRPVRIGNGASDQLQLDIYGEALNAIHILDSGANGEWGVGYAGWTAIVSVLDWLCDHWQDPDEGIWETRGGRRSFVYGQVMSWVALDRGIRMATSRGRPADLARWTAERDRIHAQVMTKGWNEELGAFVQYEGGDVLDASLVVMPLLGFLPPNDPRWQSTMAAMDKTLVTDSLVYRYDPAASPDGLPGSEGTFSLCTFLYVDALARSGRVDDARLTFSKMLTYGNHLGLYSEEIDPTGRQIGNFPQAFTHLALIAAAVNLDRQLDLAERPRRESAGANRHG